VVFLTGFALSGFESLASLNKKAPTRGAFLFNGARDGTRTRDLLRDRAILGYQPQSIISNYNYKFNDLAKKLYLSIIAIYCHFSISLHHICTMRFY
ncbi:MAG: hypothetical protein OIF36_03830, partial [Alphaproteobacteria bacterium]|nr:hypothetical protein [Alphaproteobacteria bacterium]